MLYPDVYVIGYKYDKCDTMRTRVIVKAAVS